MNQFMRFLSAGMTDADRRVADALASPPLRDTDRYLRGSALVRLADRITTTLHDAWMASTARQVVDMIAGAVTERDSIERYQSIGSVLLTAVGVHLALTIAQGPRQGWFWMVVPGIVAAFAAVLLTASRAGRE